MTETLIYRIYDPVAEKFCSSGRGLYAKNGRTFWAAKGAVMVALANMPAEIRGRLIVRTFELREVIID